jgi:glycosyltransferase 2 family protein
MENTQQAPSSGDKKKSIIKYVIYVLVVLVATAVSLTFSLVGQADKVASALTSSNPGWLAVIGILVVGSYCLDGLVILIFCRLYTRRYYYHQGCATTMVGAFYSDVTPGGSGGQIMEVYTLKRQGIEVSNAASIMVMWFILYQISLVLFDFVAIGFEWQTISSIKSFTIPGFSINIFGWEWHGDVTMVPLIIIGFALNLSITGLLFFMSYSHKFHNFIMHHVVNFLAKLHVIKNPDKTRENLRVQVENFRIELKRLQANIPVTILIIVLFLVIIFMRYSIPYFAGLSLDAFAGDGFSTTMMFKACFLSAFHQMITGLFPLPGSAGVSELFFATVFSGFFQETVTLIPGTTTYQVTRSASVNIASAQIIWRTATFHIVLLVSGVVSALYRSRPKEEARYANHQTFVNIQLETFDERKRTADTLYETKQLSRKEIQKKLSTTLNPLDEGSDIRVVEEQPPKTLKDDKKKKKTLEDDGGWDTIDIK